MALTGIPWKLGGRTRDGVDCVGLALLALREQGIEIACPTPPALHIPARAKLALEILRQHPFDRATLTRGSIVFFKDRRGRFTHVATYLGGDKFLHIVQGVESRIDRGTTLLERMGLKPAAQIQPEKAAELSAALQLPGLGWVTIALIALSVALSAAASFLTPRPKLGQIRNQSGRYGFDQLWTQTNPTLPLPLLFGAVSVAGNCPYQSRADKSQAVSDATQQKANKIVIISAGPITSFEFESNTIKINGLPYTDKNWHPSGYALNPAQSKAEAVDGTIGSDVNRPSITLYTGAHSVSVPVDIRAHFDRSFPVYGFAGCAYLVARLVDSTKYSQWNLTVTPKGLRCRQFNENGFVTQSVSNESLTGADGVKTRFKLANDDIASISSLTVNSQTFQPISSTRPTGAVYHLNKTKGFIEFITPPPASASITVSYSYYPRAWTRNPASQIIYLLTEPVRGKGVPPDKISWPDAVALRDHCDESVDWPTPTGTVSAPRYQSDYALDFRKPVQEHLRSILDACYSILVISGGKFVLRPRTAESPVFDFNHSNIIAGSFSAELIDRTQRANRVHIFYHPIETFSAETEIVRDHPENQAARAARFGNQGIVEESLRMLAVASTAQAERLGEIILRENVHTRWVIEFKTNIQGLPLQPADLITITHPSQPSWNQKIFRVEDLSLDADDRLTIRASEYSPQCYF